MLCCWISPDHNPALIQRRAPNIRSRERRAEAQVSIPDSWALPLIAGGSRATRK